MQNRPSRHPRDRANKKKEPLLRPVEAGFERSGSIWVPWRSRPEAVGRQRCSRVGRARGSRRPFHVRRGRVHWKRGGWSERQRAGHSPKVCRHQRIDESNCSAAPDSGQSSITVATCTCDLSLFFFLFVHPSVAAVGWMHTIDYLVESRLDIH